MEFDVRIPDIVRYLFKCNAIFCLHQFHLQCRERFDGNSFGAAAWRELKWNSNALFIYLWKIDRPFLLICSYSGKHPIFSYTRTNNVTQKNKLMLKDVTKLSGVHLHLSIKLRDSWSYTFSMIPLICKDSSFGFVIFQKRAA